MSMEFLRKIRETEQEAEAQVAKAREKAEQLLKEAREEAQTLVTDAEAQANEKTATLMKEADRAAVAEAQARQQNVEKEKAELERATQGHIDRAAELLKDQLVKPK